MCVRRKLKFQKHKSCQPTTSGRVYLSRVIPGWDFSDPCMNIRSLSKSFWLLAVCGGEVPAISACLAALRRNIEEQKTFIFTNLIAATKSNSSSECFMHVFSVSAFSAEICKHLSFVKGFRFSPDAMLPVVY